MVKDKQSNYSTWGFPVKFIIIFIIFLNFQQLASASCSFNRFIGTCVKFAQCPSAIELSQKGLTPGYCDIEADVVCCLDLKNNGQREKRPVSGQRRPPASANQKPSKNDGRGTQENDSTQRKKHSVGVSGIENIYETPNNFYSSHEGDQPVRRPFRPNHFVTEDDYFVPPGQAKKKWREEKTTESEYSFEQVTKKPNRGPSRKGPNKHTPNSYESNEFEEEFSNSKHNKRPSGFNSNRPNYETSSEVNNWPSNHQSGFGGNGPSYQGSSGFGENRPNYQGSSAFGGNRPSNEQNSNFGGNRPNNQQNSNFGGNRPNNQQNSNFGGNRPNNQQNSNFGGNRPNNNQPSQNTKRISEKKCEEYSRYVTKNITGLPLTTDPEPVVIPVRKCITPQQLIVGGENTTIGEFPHMAAIGFRDRNKKQIAWNCGGTLISDLFVLTAAHCTTSSSGRPVKVRLGEYNLKKNDDGAYPVDYAIVEIITHPGYKPPAKYNDIALLKLSRKVTFLKHIRPACLYVEETFSASKAIATGWGRIFYDRETSEILQKVVLNIVDNNTCNRLYKVNIKTEVLSRGIVNTQLCAGYLQGGKDTCQGDSGGPLSITSNECVHHVIGVTSFGKMCALPNSTGVYTRVSAYVPWIESVVWPN